MKRILMLLLAAAMILSLAACGGENPAPLVPTEPDETKPDFVDRGKLTILFTGGTEGALDRDDTTGALGYAALKSLVRDLSEKHDVMLIDGGEAFRPTAPDTVWEIVDACGFDLRVPGVNELSSGVDALLLRADEMDTVTYLSCNLLDSVQQALVFAPYALVEIGEVQVGFVGVTSPKALTADDAEQYALLGAEDPDVLRDTVQKAVDDAADAGADFVVVVGNLGTDPEDSPFTTAEIIAGITDLAAWLDCGSGAVLDGDTVTDKDDFEIPVCAPGAEFRYVGQVVLDLNDGTVSVELLTELETEDRTVQNLIDKLNDTE